MNVRDTMTDVATDLAALRHKARRPVAGLVVPVAAALAVLAAAGIAPAYAQAPDTRPAPAAAKTVAKPAAAAGQSAAASDGGLKSRVESLEEQLVDMQVVVGTLESLAKSGGVSAPIARTTVTGAADAGRIDSLETQVRALSGQVQQLSEQVRSMGGVPRRSDAGPISEPLAGRRTAAGCAVTCGRRLWHNVRQFRWRCHRRVD